MMSYSRLLCVVAPFALVAVALSMTACVPGETGPAPTVTVTVPAEQPSVEPTPAASEPVVETSEPVVSDTPSEETVTGGPNDESGVLDVTFVDQHGTIALQNAGTVPTGADGPTGQKLIKGPGGCFALTNEGKPQLLVFPADATFVLHGDCGGKKGDSCGKLSATIAGTEHFVGRQFNVATVMVPKTNVAGIPDRCTQGSDDTVLVVN